MDVHLAEPIITDKMIEEVNRVLRDEFFLRGDTVVEFENAFAEYVGTKHAVAVSSGTDAIQLSLSAMGVGNGDAVVTTPASFISTANAILATGAEPVFVDSTLDDYTIDLSAVREITDARDNIAAVIPVHLYGYPVDIDALREAAGGVPILADACQAHGASLRGEMAGAMADIGAFSFYPSKNMTVAGDGGMITTDNTDIVELTRSLRDVGRGQGDSDHPRIGYTRRLNTMNAAVGLEQLRNLNDWNSRRREIAAQYHQGLDGVGDIILPPKSDSERESAWYLYVIRTAHRQGLQEYLDGENIETGVHYPTPIHLHQPYREFGHKEGEFPAAERWSREVLSLPIHPQLTEQQVNLVIETIKGFFA